MPGLGQVLPRPADLDPGGRAAAEAAVAAAAAGLRGCEASDTERGGCTPYLKTLVSKGTNGTGSWSKRIQIGSIRTLQDICRESKDCNLGAGLDDTWPVFALTQWGWRMQVPIWSKRRLLS